VDPTAATVMSINNKENHLTCVSVCSDVLIGWNYDKGNQSYSLYAIKNRCGSLRCNAVGYVAFSFVAWFMCRLVLSVSVVIIKVATYDMKIQY
jgi:hypothetical protein